MPGDGQLILKIQRKINGHVPQYPPVDPPIPDLVAEFVQYSKMMAKAKETGVLDMEEVQFIHPTMLLPLFVGIKKAGPKMLCRFPLNEGAASYMKNIMQCSLEGSFGGRTYIPIVEIPKDHHRFGAVFDRICSLGGEFGGHESYMVMVQELVDNMYLHSDFENAMVMGQRYDRISSMDICFYDDGISIPGSFRRAGMDFEDHYAIRAAIEGTSSRKEAGRGFGLGTSLLTLTREYGASVLVASGQGMIHFHHSEPKGFILPDELRMQGTLISTRMPLCGDGR